MGRPHHNDIRDYPSSAGFKSHIFSSLAGFAVCSYFFVLVQAGNIMKKTLLKQVVDFCKKKLERHPERDNFPHFSFVVKNGKIVSWARNGKVEPPRHFGYHRDWDETFRPKYHAELAAYKKHPVRPPFQIVNVRLNKQGLLRISKPCQACAKVMTALGCSRFYYSFQEENQFLEFSPNGT